LTLGPSWNELEALENSSKMDCQLDERTRASKLQVLLQEFVKHNSSMPPELMAEFDFVNALIGATSAGKAKRGLLY
jgi:hypothetical protein